MPAPIEAALKYFLLGAFSSGFLVYGLALMYGSTGTLALKDIAVAAVDRPSMMLTMAMGLVIIGFAFKIAAVPFHQWVPDVYTGAPTNVTGFMAAATKAVAFAALLRVLVGAFAGRSAVWVPLIACLAVATMTVANLIALAQTNIKRLLAFSSIAHAGYLLIAVACLPQFGVKAILFYLTTYAFMTVGAFAVAAAVGGGDAHAESGYDFIASWAGLGKRQPLLAGAMTVFLLSMAGIPPTGRVHREVPDLPGGRRVQAVDARDRRLVERRDRSLLLPLGRHDDVVQGARGRRRRGRAHGPRLRRGARHLGRRDLLPRARSGAGPRIRLGACFVPDLRGQQPKLPKRFGCSPLGTTRTFSLSILLRQRHPPGAECVEIGSQDELAVKRGVPSRFHRGGSPCPQQPHARNTIFWGTRPSPPTRTTASRRPAPSRTSISRVSSCSSTPTSSRRWRMVKLAAARANFDCGQFSREILVGIEKACQEIIDGKLHDEFRLDVFQGGAGTSTNMNANEVIANRALELMGHKKGEYEHCSPHDHVNASQSTNDAYPTALHVGMALGNVRLVAAMNELIAAFRAKAKEFSEDPEDGAHPAAGRGADDARPGVRRRSPKRSPARSRAAARRSSASLRDQHGRHGDRHRSERAGRRTPRSAPTTWRRSPASRSTWPPDLIEATQDTQSYVLYSSCMKSLAIKLSKICNDLRLLSSGPRCGLREINLPADAAGLVDHARQGQPGHPRGGQPWSASG